MTNSIDVISFLGLFLIITTGIPKISDEGGGRHNKFISPSKNLFSYPPTKQKNVDNFATWSLQRTLLNFPGPTALD